MEGSAQIPRTDKTLRWWGGGGQLVGADVGCLGPRDCILMTAANRARLTSPGANAPSQAADWFVLTDVPH